MKVLFSSKSLVRNFTYITKNLVVISKAVTCLETVKLPLCDALEILKQTENNPKQAKGKAADRISAKLDEELLLVYMDGVITGYFIICKITGILCGQKAKLRFLNQNFLCMK